MSTHPSRDGEEPPPPPPQKKPVILILGAGAGIGATVGARFARGGYHACLARRSDADGLAASVAAIERGGGSASGYLLNAAEPGAVEALVERVEREVGPIETCVYNLGAQIGPVALADTTDKHFELGWRMATFGLFRLAKALLPRMQRRHEAAEAAKETTPPSVKEEGEGVHFGGGSFGRHGGGCLIVTSATAAARGNAGQHSHCAAMGGRRLLCQSLNAEYAARGVHVAHVLIDGAVDAPDTLGRMLGKGRFEALRRSRGGARDGLLVPAAAAETYWHLAHQHRSCWTFELDLRPHCDAPWWNDNDGGLGASEAPSPPLASVKPGSSSSRSSALMPRL